MIHYDEQTWLVKTFKNEVTFNIPLMDRYEFQRQRGKNAKLLQ